MSKVIFHLGMDWFYYILNKHKDDSHAVLKEMESVLVLDNSGFPSVDFLSIPDLYHDLNMRTEVEINLLKIELDSGGLSQKKYDKKIQEIKSYEYQEDLRLDFLDDCKEDSLEISILSAELLVHFVSGGNEWIVKCIKSSGNDLSNIFDKFFEKVKSSKLDFSDVMPVLQKFLSDIKQSNNINIDCNYTAKDWVRHFEGLENALLKEN